MKKLLYILLLVFMTIPLGGCFENTNTKGTKITTTVYPIEYIVNNLYTKQEITSIYPNGIDTNNYKLTNKQIDEISKSTNLFIYNGLTEEKEIARKITNKNKKIQIIDVSYGLKYTNSIEELWLSPSNYLMLCNTIKNDLIEITNNKYLTNEINENYKKIEEDLSILDANLKAIADNTEASKKTLVIADNAFGFLQDYGFNIINISDKNNITNSIKEKFKNGTYNTIYVRANSPVMDEVKDLADNYKAKLIEVETMNTLTEEERNNKEDYITIMNKFLTDLSNNTLN